MLHTAAATESLLAAIRISDLITRDGRGVQVLLKRLRLTGIVGKNLRGLSRLALSEVLNLELGAEGLDFVVLGVNLVLAHLVEDSLRVSILVCQHVTDSIGDSGAVCACLTGDISSKVGKAKAVLAAAIRELLRQTEHLLHVGHLTGIGSLLNTGEPGCKGHLDIRTAVAELGRKATDVRLDSIQRHDRVLVGETLSCQLCLIEPRIKHVTTCISVATETTVAVAPAEQDEQKQDPPAVSTPAAVATVAVADTVGHCRNVAQGIIGHSHAMLLSIFSLQ